MSRLRLFLPLASLTFLLVPPCRAELEWEQKEISLAPAVGTKQIEVSYTFTNRGDQPVRVWVERSSCGCVTPALEKDVYQSGESGTIRAVYKPGGQSGHQEKTIHVATDEPGATQIVLLLKVDLPESYKLTPRLLRWKAGEEVAAKTATISLPAGAAWNAPELQVPVGFQAVLETVKAGEHYTVRISPETTTEASRASLVVQLKGEGIDPVRLPVLLVVQ